MITEMEHWRARDSRGVVMPWYTRPCLAWLDTFIGPGMRIFEYGCGVSSVWYRSRQTEIRGVDNNPEWIFFPEEQLLAHEQEDYIRAVEHTRHPFDIIVIDGIYRDECTAHALGMLKKGGYLIADNFEQPSVEEFWPNTRALTKHLPITVYKEPEHYDWKTAVWRNV